MVAPGEPGWTDEDRAWALAWQDYQADQCGGCGHPLSVTTKKENQFAYGGEIVRCHACAAQTRIVRKYADQDGSDQAGVMVRMTTSPDE